MRCSRQAHVEYAPTPERLEDRRVPSISPFVALPPLQITGDNAVVPAVGSYHSGSTELPFIAVTYQGDVSGGGVNVFLGDGQGHFKAPENIPLGADAEPEDIIVGQFAHSGFDDLAVADNKGSVFILLAKGDGSFGSPIQLASPPGTLPTYLATATIGGSPYLFCSDFSDNEVLVYRGDGAGGFTSLPPLSGVSNPEQIVVADFNRDRVADLAVANKNGGTISIFEGEGSGEFAPPSTIRLKSSGGRAQLIGLAVADLNGDGAPDLAVADYGSKGNPAGSVDLLKNTGAIGGPISFRVAKIIPLGQRLVNVAAVELGGPLPGLAVTSSGTNRVIVLQNRGSFNFRTLQSVKVGRGPLGMVASKVTNDDPFMNDDLIVAESNSGDVRVLQNQTSHG